MKIRQLSKEEIDKIALEFEKERLDRESYLKNYLNSPRFKEVILKIKDIVKEDGAIGDNPYQEPLFSDVSNEEFISLFEIAFNPELSNCKIETESDAVFATEFVMFEDLKFIEIHGQGTAFIIQGKNFKT